MTTEMRRFRRPVRTFAGSGVNFSSSAGARPAPGWPYDRGARMKYAMFIVMDPEATEADDAAAPSIEDWFDYMIERGAFIEGIRLEPRSDATTVRVRGGQVLITDGPFTESREWIAGLAIIEVADLAEAIEQALRHNMAYQGRLEIRPIHGMGGRGEC
jgi:hypothetical protein